MKTLKFSRSLGFLVLSTVFICFSNVYAQGPSDPYESKAMAIHPPAPKPEIKVLGNGNNISNTGSTTSTNNLTDFGSIPVCQGEVDHTFTIKNIGDKDLNIDSISLGGTAAGEYSLIPPVPNNWVIAANGGSTTFTVRFNPNFPNVRDAEITILNDDPNEATFDFPIKGIGLADVTPPTISCPPNITVSNDPGQCSGPATYNAATATDNCTAVSTAHIGGLASGSNFPVGTHTILYQATDTSSNIVQCSFTVTVQDTSLPSITTCPPNITLSADVNCQAVGTYVAVATDLCSAVTLDYVPVSGSTFGLGMSTVIATATDLGMNTASCSFMVTVEDQMPPTIVCPLDTILPADATCGATVTYIAPTGIDNCTGATTTRTNGLASGAAFPLGVTTNEFQVTDDPGTTATCSFTITVLDQTPPIAICQNITIALDPSGTATIPPSVDNGSFDVCSPISLQLSQTAVNCNNIGVPLAVTLTVSDTNGNTSTCASNITVLDTTPPIALCRDISLTLDALGHASTTASAINFGSSDSCGIAFLALSQTTFTCTNIGPNSVILTVEDNTGNTAACAAIVHVRTQILNVSVSLDERQCGKHVSCKGGADGVAHVSATSTCPGLSYLWTDGSTSATASHLAAGPNAVTVTDVGGETTVRTFMVTEPASPLLIQLVSTTASCEENDSGAATISASGGSTCQPYLYAWNNGNTTPSIEYVFPDTYAVIVMDAQGCITTQNVTVPAYPVPNPAFTLSGNVFTSTQSWETYQWLLNGIPIPGAIGPTLTYSTPGSYTLSVTNAFHCHGTSLDSINTALNDPWATGLNLMLFPNPTLGTFQLQTSTPIGEALTVEVTDIYGRNHMKIPLPRLQKDIALNIQPSAPGNYIVIVTTESGQRQILRLILQ